MTTHAASPVPPGLPGLDVRFSHVRTVPEARRASPDVAHRAPDDDLQRRSTDGTGDDVEWHYLDNGPVLAAHGIEPVGTVLAVHGNPTWSYLWRSLVELTTDSAVEAAAADGERPDAVHRAWRVVAVDQLEMGLSARTGRRRTLPQRVADLGAFTDSLGLTGPVVTLGHDWGGVVSLGWAVDHPDLLAGVTLLNTAVHQPAGVPIPAPLRLALARGVHRLGTSTTGAFLETTLALARPRLDHDVADAYRLPYRTAADRAGIEDFVADIPATLEHPSRPELDRIAAGVARLDVPALLLWGPHDPIFSDRYLADLVGRLPHARVHRFSAAGHLIAEDVEWAPPVVDWLGSVASVVSVGSPVGPDVARADAFTGPGGPSTSGLTSARATSDPTDSSEAVASARSSDGRAEPGMAGPGEGVGSGTTTAGGYRPMWAGLDERAASASAGEPAVLDQSGTGPASVSWRALDRQVRRIAAGLHGIGVRRGDRVSLLVQPGPTLTALVYACLRIGAVVVVADAGLGVKGLTRAQRGAWPGYLVGQRKALAAARAFGWPGVRISADPLEPVLRRALGVDHELVDVARAGDVLDLPPEPGPDDEAAVLFTSGSTGPAKGVVYTHARLAALRDALAGHFAVGPDTGLVTGFAPFALLGPALGTRSVTPDMDVSAPRTLTARAVADAVRASDARMVFLSPAAILNVVDTASALDADDRDALGRVETFLSTGAPISAAMLTAAQRLMPAANPHTPYGMTECLLVSDITLDGVRAAADAPDAGVCVGRPVGEGRVLISALDADGAATGAPSDVPGVLGEVLVSAPHLKERYDRLWLTDVAAERDTPAGHWHRTGDVGHLDADGRLWIEGRLAHVLVTADGPLAPVGPEQGVERADGVRRAAVVGVGPAGVQQAVAVVETVPPTRRPGLAPDDVDAAVRASSPVPLAAVLAVPVMPTDVRHNSKIDRARLAAWAAGVLGGGRVGAP
ncbi:alpha/beta fold hydrolase [Isoptericola dokdonensis]|uniref:Long-chain-fatty-acid--CoA ligase n=1 Tax=Isoptericola dokdonensis DS-3 TaxID=1300344 RepID=A0A168FMM8_9MICO|nr:alpha/beta fold hydrolase [Isoptericola dokdonensis]ANC32141.1 Long-chain-fatty-acid--CoA ligase [Isoptericola dokdonensis DS-3]